MKRRAMSAKQTPGTVANATSLVQAGCHSDQVYGGVSTPLHFATTFTREAEYAPDVSDNGLPAGFPQGYVYSRVQHPTRAQLEMELAKAEGAYMGDVTQGVKGRGDGICRWRCPRRRPPGTGWCLRLVV